MTEEKFQEETSTLKKFFTKFCEDTHKNQYIKNELNLCDNCHKLIAYSFDRLKECPHEIKPRCRRCPNPCYEKNEWKSLAKIMKYSGLKFGLNKIGKYLGIKPLL